MFLIWDVDGLCLDVDGWFLDVDGWFLDVDGWFWELFLIVVGVCFLFCECVLFMCDERLLILWNCVLYML